MSNLPDGLVSLDSHLRSIWGIVCSLSAGEMARATSETETSEIMKFLKVIAITAAALGAVALSSCSQSAPAAPPSYVAPAK